MHMVPSDTRYCIFEFCIGIILTWNRMKMQEKNIISIIKNGF